MSTPAVDYRNERQQSSFNDVCDLWSVDVAINASTGKPADETVALAYTDVPCRIIYTPNLSDPTGVGGRSKRKTVFTIDGYQFCADQQVQDGWFAVNKSLVNGTPGPLFHEVHGMQGTGRVMTNKGERQANNRVCMALTNEHTPTAIQAFYGIS